MSFRAKLVHELDRKRPDWRSLTDPSLSDLLISMGQRTATGRRFDPDRVRELRRSLSKADAKAQARADQAAQTRAAEAMNLAEEMRVTLKLILEDLLRGGASNERMEEIEQQLSFVGLTLLEDRFASFERLHRAYQVIDRRWLKDAATPLAILLRTAEDELNISRLP